MKHVIEVENGDAQVLTKTGSGGLIGRGLLHDCPLGEYVEPAETPRFVVRNRRRGVTVEATDGSASDDAVETEQVVPDSDHSAVALVTDVRVLFAVGRAGGDRTQSVALGDVVDARAETGLRTGALVLDTVTGAQYRFPTRGDLDAVREFVDAAAGVWSRAERHLEAAEETLDRVERAFESGDVDVVLAAVGDVRETLGDAREAAASLDGAAASVDDRIGGYRDRLRLFERRAYAEQAEQARERGHTRWDDEAYETAADHFERAADSYAAALSVDADRPTDELIERRRANLDAERERLAASPLERAEQAVEVARSTDDTETAVTWWERALERYERLRALDWGRDDPRFDGDREAVRERLATGAERLVEAHCEQARRALDAADGAPPTGAAAACDRAEPSLDAARAVARERVPDAVETVEELDDRLADRRPGPAATRRDDTDGTETVVVPSEGADSGAADGESAADDAEGGGADLPDGEWTLADDERDDEWLTAERTATSTDAEGVDDADGTGGVTDASDPEVVADAGEGWTPATLGTLGADGFRRVVADCFGATGWTVETGDDDAVDLCAAAPGPAGVRAGVLAVHADAVATVDGSAVDRFATAVERDADLDAAVVVAGATLPPDARDRAEEAGVTVVAPDTLVADLDEHRVSAPDAATEE
jgi:tetratricopeptide (TPR) repeat protein